MARRKPSPLAGQMELGETPTTAKTELPASAPTRRPPIVLTLGPRSFAIAIWVRDERDTPIYKIAQRDIKAASTAATMAQQADR